jgi:hypothetical protein
MRFIEFDFVDVEVLNKKRKSCARPEDSGDHAAIGLMLEKPLRRYHQRAVNYFDQYDENHQTCKNHIGPSRLIFTIKILIVPARSHSLEG